VPTIKRARAELLNIESGAVVHTLPVEVSISDGEQPSVKVRAHLPGVRADLDNLQFRMRLAGVTDDVRTTIRVNPSGPSTECSIWLEGAAWRSTDWLAKL